MAHHWLLKPGASFLTLFLLLLLLAVACGATATAVPDTKQNTTPAPGEAATPTAVPAPAVIPQAPVVNPGKLTWMIAGWGNERFTYNYSGGGGNNYARYMHGFLIATNEKTELIPGIASRWEISPDGKTWTFTIRTGASFHDGSKVTAQDVWWSFMHYWGKDESGSAVERVGQGSAQAQARVTVAIEQPTPDKASITTKNPDAGFPAAMVSEATGNWYGVVPKRPKVHDTAQEEAYDKRPIGAGPFKLVKHVPADLMSFERFDGYYYQPSSGLPEDRRSKFKSLELRLVPEEGTRVAAIRAGEADIAPASLTTKKQVEAGGGRLVFGREGAYMHLRLPGCYKPRKCSDLMR